MSDFFGSVRADLLDRRMRALLALVVVAVVAALAYALLGGGGGSAASTPATLPLGAGSAPAGISVSASAANSNRAVAEVSGSPAQRRGSARNPFAPLPGSASTAPTTAATATAKSSAPPTVATGSSVPSSGSEPSTTPSTGGGGTNSGGVAPSVPKKKAPATKKKAPATKKKAAPQKAESKYLVDVLFGPIPAGTPVQNAQLAPHTVVTIWQKFPSEQDRMLSFARVTSEPRKAKFNLIGEVIPRGQADCLPQPSKCEAIALGPGQSEELERRSQTGQPEVFGLQVLSIRPRSQDRNNRAKSARLALEHGTRR